MSTDTTSLLEGSIANRVRSYVSPSSVSVNTLKAMVYVDMAAADAPFLYVVLRIGDAVSDDEYGGRRQKLALEAMCYGRSREDRVSINALADVVTQALLTFRESSADFGLTFFTGVHREGIVDLPTPSAPEAIGLKLVLDGATWPAVLTDALT